MADDLAGKSITFRSKNDYDPNFLSDKRKQQDAPEQERKSLYDQLLANRERRIRELEDNMKPQPPKPLDEEEVKYFQELEQKREMQRKQAQELEQVAVAAFQKKMESEENTAPVLLLTSGKEHKMQSTVGNTTVTLDKIKVVKKKKKQEHKEAPAKKKAKPQQQEQQASLSSLLAAYQDTE